MTPATAFLKAKGIAFTEHEYEYVEHGGTEVPSRALRVAEHHIVKTLVMEDEARKPLIVLMHGDRQVSTKNLARRPGASPSSYINAGRRGLLVKLHSADLAGALEITLVDVARED